MSVSTEDLWAIGLVYPSPEAAKESTSKRLVDHMLKKGLTPVTLGRLSGVPEEKMSRLLNQGIGDVSTFSRATVRMGMMLDELVPMPSLEPDQWRQVDAKMTGAGGGFKNGTGGDLPPQKKKELRAFLALRVIDELASLS